MAKKFKKILKFGGSSVGSAERIRSASKVISDAAKKDRIAVVVSAMQGVTDKLLALDFEWVKDKHIETAKNLGVRPPLELLKELGEIINGVKLIGDASPISLDLMASFGERLSATLIADYLKKLNAIYVDSRGLIKTDNNFQNAAVDFSKTNGNIRRFFNKISGLPIITGFISSTRYDKTLRQAQGRTTTLGRGGSDYSAAIFGSALGVEAIEIWTDANGIMSADPRIVYDAITLPEISYEDAFEMAYFGAKVIYPPTMLPAIKKSIPIVIKNTFNPSHPGTLIADEKNAKNDANDVNPIKNISALDGISLINVGGTNLAGVPGTAQRVFKAVASKGVNVILISQASSEQSICLAVKNVEADKALDGLRVEFANEIQRRKIYIEQKTNQSIVAVVGEKMRGVPGISGKIFNVLGKNQINVAAIAQGSSERNISFVVNESDKVTAINSVHKEFFSKEMPAIFLIGVGVVGSELLRQLRQHDFRVCGIANSKNMFFDPSGIDFTKWRLFLDKRGESMSWNKFLERAQNISVKEKILVDCTANEEIAKNYEKFALAGFHIVTPNKKANVLPLGKYVKLRHVLKKNGKYFLYDANVGAGLPIISSVKNLVAIGDKIKKIEGIFSGTLSYLFNNFTGKKFSKLVSEAKAKGYTEPDPREDLSGQDVGRKLLILAREMGMLLEFSDLNLENLAEYSDEYFANKYRKAKEKNCVLRYVGSVKNGRLSAKLKEIPIGDPLSNTSGTDNVVAIYTKYYKNPLVIKGPGAGAEVTAAAVLKGVLEIINKI